MNHILIRSYPKDDYLSMLCYHSFKRAGIEGEYSFFAEDGRYNLISQTGEKIVNRNSCENFGGQLGVKALINGLKQYSFNPEDTVIISDTDIVVKYNFLDIMHPNTEHAGTGGVTEKGLMHISGQMQILKGSIVNRLCSLSESEINSIVFCEMDANGQSVADDTFISYVTDKWNCKKEFIHGAWIHEKFYRFEGNQDYKGLINYIINDNR